ncbi:THUMP domain-containing protein [Acidianus sp. HS-5]|uniref:THUMP domain-containing protein n=1 Tax=Acidianus sp. HS-5 TaxID=2886040 RepID=UPI001F2AEC80|nr:THUMP domain-containing protein [Acidianus sp. HS-5]BDC18998.1 RNA methyltransferase [Acidianus sp. HS-5]
MLNNNMEPKLIITALAGKGKKCKMEILDRLLIKDDSADVNEVKQNVFLVCSKLSPLEAYGLIISAPPACMGRIFIVNKISKLSEVFNDAEELLLSKKIKKFYVECISRGNKQVDCRSIEIGIGLKMKGKIEVDYKNPDYILFVNLIGDYAYLSLMRKGQEKVSVNSL